MLVLYFDVGGMTEDTLARAVASGSQFVETQMRPTDRAAILTWNGSQVRVLEDFTADRDKLASEMQYISGYMRGAIRARDQLGGLRTATIMLGALPEKKALVYFTTSESRQAFTQDQLQPVIEAAQRANVAFYPIDVSAPYVIGPGDTLSISVSPPQSGRVLVYNKLAVGADGTIDFPAIGAVKAAGLTTVQLQAEIGRLLAARVKTPSVTITVISIQKRGK
jgi:VWFA-related protein